MKTQRQTIELLRCALFNISQSDNAFSSQLVAHEALTFTREYKSEKENWEDAKLKYDLKLSIEEENAIKALRRVWMEFYGAPEDEILDICNLDQYPGSLDEEVDNVKVCRELNNKIDWDNLKKKHQAILDEYGQESGIVCMKCNKPVQYEGEAAYCDCHDERKKNYPIDIDSLILNFMRYRKNCYVSEIHQYVQENYSSILMKDFWDSIYRLTTGNYIEKFSFIYRLKRG